MNMRDDDDLTTEELLSMWREGEPVTVVSTRLELENVPWAHEFDSASRGLLPAEGLTRHHGAVVRPRGPSIQESDTEDAMDRSA